ncbi:uncharacterized protein LOC126832361 isoform X2 [Patella vulgata]|uniref:uncharacterized protein LOC126832361 isoform X2 n=1 Tax=Patella vulgata TaxID=6465 RepID=UPI00217FA3DD|nr:uncharacterized protein LOC126832361 isoform X2 [Patella vulgata]
MRIYELPWLLYLLLLVFVDQVAVTSCPNGCLGDGDTLTCKDINNGDLPELYMCINDLPNVAILDIRSELNCDCELLYLTNHHVNPDLIVFAPIECSTEVSVACGYRQSAPAPDENLVEIAGKFFDVRRADLQDNLNKHLEGLVQKVYKIRDPEKRLKYVSAVLMNTRDAIDKMRGVPTTTLPRTTTIATPVTTPKNVLAAAFHPLWEFFKSHRSKSDPSKDSEPTITTTTPLGKTSKNRLEAAFEPLWKFFKGHASNSESEKISTKQENTNKAPYHIEIEPSGWKHFIEDQVTPKASTLTTPKSIREIWADDMRLKYTIFGCIIVFIMLVVVMVLFAMTQNKRNSLNKPNKGDLDVHSYYINNNIWNKMKGKVQTEYKRRSVDDEQKEQKDKSVVITNFNMPKANLVNMGQTEIGAVAVSGLTAAIPQQPVSPAPPRSNKVKTESLRASSPVQTQTRLLYKTGLYPGSSDGSITTFERAVPSDGRIITKSAEHKVNFGRRSDTTEKPKDVTSASKDASKDVTSASKDVTNASKDVTYASKDVTSSLNGKTDTSPVQKEPTPISSDEHVEKTLFMKNYGHKSGYSLTEDVKGTVKIYEPTKFTQDARVRERLKLQRRSSTGGGYSDEEIVGEEEFKQPPFH